MQNLVAACTTAWELVKMREMSEVEDHKIELIGPDVDTLGPEGGKLPLACTS